jgi:Domain of unknown function (DUF4833)
VIRGSWLSVVTPAVAAGALLAGPVQGDPEGRDVASVFHVAKSENRNQVHYGVHLDASCAPVGPEPVFAYWRMLEHGPSATEPLLPREVGAYGLSEQRVLDRSNDGGRLSLRLRALPARTVVVQTARRGEGCVATATAVIGGVQANLDSVFVQLKWPFGVAHLVLSGHALADGRPVREVLSD